ncbi:hypothetical protein CHS0354_039697 [Potamilus streckersoni]|uniref:Uncharacterized protein n=1 Tax=Potamilus streckersoni TaxID=2493646 RepID=A0AAE0VVC1_9BIVA|nr:hypothetical protein CHS0354_039697 [Potamilus streckersoni]
MATNESSQLQESAKHAYFSPYLNARLTTRKRSQTRFLPKRDSVENHSDCLAIQGLKLIAASEDKYKPVIQSENRRRWRNLVRVCRIPLDTMLRICLCWVQDPQRKRGRLHGDRAKNS